MFKEERPTCITVIGWAWIIIGGLMTLSAIFALIGLLMIEDMSQGTNEITTIVKIFPFLVTLQIIFAGLGFVSGINLLKLKSWARNVLEVQSWILLLFTIGFMLFWIYKWIAITEETTQTSFGLIGLLMGIMGTAIYVIPLIIILKYLRGPKVKNAITPPA